MPGLTEITNVTLHNVTSVVNVSSLSEFYINVNNTIYGGIFFFIVLWVLWIILFFAFDKMRDGMLSNAIYATAIVSIISLLMRGVFVIQLGVEKGLLTDNQLWAFPIIFAVLALVKFSLQD